MADITFNVYISDGFHQKVLQMIASSGVTPKELFEKAVVLTEAHNLAGKDYKQDFAELEALMTRINELAANMIKREIYLNDELAAKTADIASFTANLENSTKEIAELQRQIDELRETNEKNQSFLGSSSNLVAEQEIQLKELKEAISTKENIITSFVVSLENSKKEIAELQKQVDQMKATIQNNEILIGEYKEKLGSLSGTVSTDQQNDTEAKENSVLTEEPNTEEGSSMLKEIPNPKEENSALKEERKAQKKKLKKLLKEIPNAEEKVLAELLGVDSSYITELRKEI